MFVGALSFSYLKTKNQQQKTYMNRETLSTVKKNQPKNNTNNNNTNNNNNKNTQKQQQKNTKQNTK